jgi:hypothetical protein
VVDEKTIKKYSLTLHRLIYGVLRQIDPSYSHRYRYPTLHDSQLDTLRKLRQALDDEMDNETLVNLFQAACFSLFAHHKHIYPTSRVLDQFFSPVICFLLASSCKEEGGFHMASTITQPIAHIMFCIRAVVFCEIVKKGLADNISLYE